MLVRLDDLEATQGATLGQTTGRVVANDTGDSFGIAMVLGAIQAAFGTAMCFVLTGMVVLGNANGFATTFNAVYESTTKDGITHGL